MEKSIVISFTLVSALLVSSDLWAADPPARSLVRGKQIYTVQCAGCHGDSGEDTPRGEGTKTLPGIHIRRTDYEIGHRFRGLMATLFTEDERADLVAYVKSLKGSKGYERPEYLINPVGLAPFVTDPGVRIVDLRSEDTYLNAHMPNAVHLNPARLHPIPDPDTFAALMTAIGIGDDTYVVAYDEAGSRSATLLWSLLQEYGHPRVSVLDGGWQAWVREMRSATHWTPSKRQVTFTPRPRTYGFIQTNGEDIQHIMLVDTGARFAGATSSPPMPQFHPLQTDGTFLPAADLNTQFKQVGVHSDQTILLKSPDMMEAAQALFVFHLLGYPRVHMMPVAYRALPDKNVKTPAF